MNSTERIESQNSGTTCLRSSEELNFQGPSFAKYRDLSEIFGRACENVSLGMADRIINLICEFGRVDDKKFLETSSFCLEAEYKIMIDTGALIREL